MTEDEKRALKAEQYRRWGTDPAAHKYARQAFAHLNFETCICNHLRKEHDDTLIWGHGDCLATDCTCMKFTLKEEI